MTSVLSVGRRDWPVRRLRFLARLNPSRAEARLLPPDADVSFVPMEAVGEGGGLTVEEVRPLESVYSGYTFFRDGDVVVAKITPCFENGKGALASRLVNGVAFGTTELHVLRPSGALDARFLFYVTMSPQFRDAGTAAMTGAAGQKRVPEDFLLDYELSLPSLADQQAIADFLDEKTAAIDGLIAKKERLIDLIEEKRQAAITRAVTKGLDPDVPMKDSGVEWLGEVPEHWRIAALRRFVSIGSGEYLPNDAFDPEASEDRAIPVIGGNGVMGWTSRPNTLFRTLAIGRVGAQCGNVHQITGPAWITDNALRLSHVSDVDLAYLEHILRALDLNRIANRSAQPLVTGSMVLAQRIPIPPPEEARQVAAECSRATLETASLKEAVVLQIKRLRDYRQTLISAAVTGQIDVRSRAARTEDVLEEALA